MKRARERNRTSSTTGFRPHVLGSKPTTPLSMALENPKLQISNSNKHFVADFGYHTICGCVCVCTRVVVHTRSKKAMALENPRLQISNWAKNSSSPTTWQFGVHYVAWTRRWEGSNSRKPGSPQVLWILVCTVVVRAHPRGTVP